MRVCECVEREREREMWSRVVGVSVGAATAYAVTDALDELCLYLHCKRYEALSLSLSLSLCVCVFFFVWRRRRS